MRKSFLFIILLSVISLAGFSQIGADIFVGYLWGLNPLTPTGSITTLDGATGTTHMIDAGFLIDYEIADGFSIGAGVGGAFPLTGPMTFMSTEGDGSKTESQFLLDGLLGVSYFYPLQPVLLQVNVLGGISFFNFQGFDNLGYLIKAKFGLGYDIGGMVVSLGAGYEMRTYNLSTREEGNPDPLARGSVTIHSIPIELGITIRF